MKKLSFFIVVLLLNISLIFSQDFTVLMNVDMHGSGLTAGQAVYLSGNFSGIYGYWNVPGSNPENELTDADYDSVYSITMYLPAGDYQFKFFRGTGWNGGEWGGEPNRTATVVADTTFATFIWGDMPVVVTPLLAVFNVDMHGSGLTAGQPVYISGNFGWIYGTWNMPGNNPENELTDADYDSVYSITMYLPAGDYQFKFFKGTGWNGGEWGGIPNRTVTLNSDTTFATFIWGMWKDPVGVGINNSGREPDQSAMLDVRATDRGLLIPRFSTADLDQIPSPATGLLIYNTTSNRFNYYNGSFWYQLGVAFISSATGSLNPGGGFSISATSDITADNSAILDITNPTRGILIPRTVPNTVMVPATGLIIYNTSENQLNYYDGAQWITLCAISTGLTGAGGSQGSVGVAINEVNAPPHPSAILDISATDKGILIPRVTSEQRNEILPATGLVIFNSTNNKIEFFNGSAWFQIVTNAPASPEAGAHIASTGQVIWNWDTVPGAEGYKWNTVNNYFSAIDLGINNTKTETALACGTGYTCYAWAYNGCGFSEPATLTQTTADCFVCGTSLTINHVAGAVAPVTKAVTYGTVTNIPGETSKCWIASNLGAIQQATAVDDATEASAGWYWQFNRKQGYKHDGSTRTPDNAWITTINENSDWIAINDPCRLEIGSGWRIPTATEWANVDAAGGWSDWNGPWNSGLKIHAAGFLHLDGGGLVNRGVGGNFWSNNQATSASGWYLEFYSGYSLIKNYEKSYGCAMRCILNCQSTLSSGTFSENFESYTVDGYIADQDPERWTTWSNAPGTGEDGMISNAFASSPTKSVLVDDTDGPTDLILKLGDKSTGKYELKWMMYIELTKAGYYNIQHFQFQGIEWANEVYFRTGGNGELYAGSATAIPFTYPKDTWFEVKHLVDLDADNIKMYINGTLVHDWPFSYQASSTSGTKQLGAVNFWAGAASGSGEIPKYFFDDVSFTAVPDQSASYDQATWNWNPVNDATGYKWNSINDYDSGEDMCTSTTKTETGLTCGNDLTRYVWAYNDCSHSATIILTQSTLPCFSCGSPVTINHIAGDVAPVTKTVTYSTVSKIPGETSKCWITSNLGADHRAYAVDDATEASAGWYWQFNNKQGYKHDGTTRKPDNEWTTTILENSDWIVENDPCRLELGSAWRIPTSSEWINVDAAGGWSDWNGPWNSGLKIHAAGYLSYNNGSLNQRGSDGDYWSSKQHAGVTGWFLGFNDSYSVVYNDGGSDGFPLRCLRDASSIIAAPEVTTTAVSGRRGNEATGGGNVTGDGGSPVTARGICWSTSANPTLANDHTIDGRGKGSFVSELDSLIANTLYYVRAYAASETDTVYGNEVSFSSWSCGDPITYSLDSIVYNTVLIGTQCWFRENLNVGAMVTDDYTGAPHTHCSDNGIIEKYCYNNDSEYCNEYGGLYDWNEMVRYHNIAGSQGICPTGWHIPTDAEQAILTAYLGGESEAGGALKETGTAHWDSPNTGATNASGFTAFGSGCRGAEGFSTDILSRAYYWLSNENSAEWSPSWYLEYQNAISNLNADYKTCGLSVRCLQDGPGGDSLSPDAVIIDTTTSQLLSDSTQLSQGIYIFEFSGSQPPLEAGNIITGAAGDGYLRKVTAVSNSGNQVTVQTTQATMEELFNTVDIGFESGISSPTSGNSSGQPGNVRVKYLAKGVTVNMDEEEGFTFDFSNTPIYNEGDLSFTITDGSAVFNPHFTADIKYRWFKVSEFYIATKNSTLSVDCNVNLHASAGIPPINKEIELANINTKVPVPGVPVFVVINTQLTAKLEVTLDAAIDINTGFTDFYYASMGMKYIDHNWSKWCTVKDELDFAEPEVTGQVHLVQKLTITPKVSAMLYGVIGPYFTPELWQQFDFAMASPSLDWDASLDLGLDAKAGVTVAVIGDIEALSTNIPFSYHLWNAPDAITIVSGDMQPGTPGQPLPLPLKVLVTDTLNYPLPNVPVYFEVTGGGGSVSSESIPTGADGYAETYWTLGTEPEEQVLNASMRDANGKTIDEKDFTLLEPSSIEIFSGDNQSGGILGQPLPAPIEVIVYDIDGYPFTGATVNFTANNGGSVSSSQVTTGEDGIASVTWTLGPTDIIQTVTVTSFKSDNTTHLEGSPLTFTVTIPQGEPCPGLPTITDPRDGQVYPTVQIGVQCWLQKNMNYQTGTSWCYYNDPANCTIYGRLYDWGTALGVCPSGWHLPSETEWNYLEGFLGGLYSAGGKMKETGTAHWNAPNTDATNISGFTALPAGNYQNPNFWGKGQEAWIWSSSEYGDKAKIRHMYYTHGNFGWSIMPKSFGISVRCLND